MKSGILFLAIVSVAFRAGAQQASPFPAEMYSTVTNRENLRSMLTEAATRDIFGGDLVVGFPNPNEIREISGPLDVVGDIIVLNNGELRISGGELGIHGNIVLMGNGKLTGTGGSLRFNSQYIYQRSILIANKAACYLNGTSISLGGFNVACGITDTALFHLDNLGITGGTLTTTANEHAVFEAANAQSIGEILFFDESSGNFADCTGLLTWLTAAGGCDYSLQCPGNQIPGIYLYPDSTRKAAGMDYRIKYERCYDLFWGLIHESGSSVEISGSDLLACGALFDAPQTVTVTNLVNNVNHRTFDYPAADRSVRFIDTRVGTWNLYPRSSAQLSVSNCIFGEALAMGNSTCQITNCVCDGTGGYLGSTDNATITMAQSLVYPDVVARNGSRIFLLSCSLSQGDIVSSDNAAIGVFNTTFSSYPKVSPGSIALIVSIDEPSRGYAGEVIPVYGTIDLVKGADVPVAIDPYWLEYGLAALPDDRRPLGTPGYAMKYRERLAEWDTKALNAGQYRLYANIRLSTNDTIAITRDVQLIEPPVSAGTLPQPGRLALSLYPNPVVSGRQVFASVEQAVGEDWLSYNIVAVTGAVVRSGIETRISGSIDFTGAIGGLPPGLYKLVVYSNAGRTASQAFIVTK